jgi:hypothetical protein
MAGYSGTPLWKKLGYKTGLRAYLDGAPDDYVQLLELPRDVQVIWLGKKESNMPLGLVDIKVCAVDEVWSALKLMIRRERRR